MRVSLHIYDNLNKQGIGLMRAGKQTPAGELSSAQKSTQIGTTNWKTQKRLTFVNKAALSLEETIQQVLTALPKMLN